MRIATPAERVVIKFLEVSLVGIKCALLVPVAMVLFAIFSVPIGLLLAAVA